MAAKRKLKTKLTKQVLVYIEPGNKAFASKDGAKKYGSVSAYINALIAQNRGAKAAPGIWKSKV